MRLSEAIRLGVLSFGEERNAWVTRDSSYGCALGTAFLACGGKWEDLAGRYSPIEKDGVFQKMFPEYSREILLTISGKHYAGESRLSLADWLEKEIEPALFPEAKCPSEDINIPAKEETFEVSINCKR